MISQQPYSLINYDINSQIQHNSYSYYIIRKHVFMRYIFLLYKELFLKSGHGYVILIIMNVVNTYINQGY